MKTTNENLKKDILKEMTSFIKRTYPEGRPMPSPKRRPPKYTDNELIEIAIEAKSRFMGQINGRILGEITPINYNIWNRREEVKNAILKLNQSIVNGSMFSIDESENLYHVNIDMLVDRYKNNIPKLKETLYFIEESRIKLYDELKKLKVQVNTASNDSLIAKKLKNQVSSLKLESETYKRMYENLVIVTSTAGLKEMNKAKDSALDLTRNTDKLADIVDLNHFFPANLDTKNLDNKNIDIGAFFDSRKNKE